ncbi:MAG: class I SAM-dependent methyltransferase [Lachnospiraceae bacterium]|jgi:2-polyprenyl-3-methyl-5-hydroxy-6-metoxy-1,4-benzoquinol methylase|nr:class I SAM-dependent methyltransferase [Lachnospiraceae bacterium]
MKEQIKQYYENYDEKGRLFRDKAHLVEWLTTIRYFDRLFAPGSRILDCCAGTGHYSFYLADKGHHMTTGDLVPHNVELIKAHPKANLLDNIMICDVMDMPQFEENSFDIVLCMGALYHLATDAQKRKAIANCVAITKPGGLVVLSYINYFAAIASDTRRGLDHFPEMLTTMSDEGDYLFKVTTPTKITKMSEGAGLKILHHLGTDGISYIISDKINEASKTDFESWSDYIYQHCEEPSILGYSMHGLLIGQKS